MRADGQGLAVVSATMCHTGYFISAGFPSSVQDWLHNAFAGQYYVALAHGTTMQHGNSLGVKELAVLQLHVASASEFCSSSAVSTSELGTHGLLAQVLGHAVFLA